MSRVVVITGVAGGIGSACAAAFKAEGWRVAGTDKGSQPAGVACDWYEQIDLGVRATTDRLKTFFAEVGQIDALVNNAAIQITRPLVETTDADWAAVMATNAGAPFVAIREAVPFLEATKGAIVNVASVHAVATSSEVAAYAASKGALVALTRAAALELGPAGIRVNAVLPGAIDTPMLRAGVDARLGASDASDSNDPFASLAERTPLRRVGQPHEIASVVVFLADGTRSSFVTGQGWAVDGGVTARLASE
ncbi:MAG TPA: SDR family oxidoreductase [Candidatus Limnocylindria bacterium]|nr:SDR family oxidoreductase [Candidatus Limnocylindria bacterium]